MIKSTITAATLGLALMTAPAMANQGPSESVSIEYRDLNLSTPEGQKRLDRRINQAAAKICQMKDARTGTRVTARNSKDCYNKARQSAAKQVASIVFESQRGG